MLVIAIIVTGIMVYGLYHFIDTMQTSMEEMMYEDYGVKTLEQFQDVKWIYK